MNRFAAVLGAACVVGCLSVGADSAQAQIFAPSYGFAGGTGPYNIYTQDPPPYFALYPPVYYSRPLARTYGFSPFAYPPGYPTPQNQFLPPQGIQSSGISDGAPPAAMTNAVAQQPLVIENPFFHPKQ